MPRRRETLVTGEIYHVFNRGIDKRPTFTDRRELLRAVETLQFYRLLNPPAKLSLFLRSKLYERSSTADDSIGRKNLIEVLAFCFMPNHFHFLLKQTVDGGISKFLSNFLNSYTKYFNTKHERTGPLFLGQFKAVHIENDEQLLHVSRYIHLNPYSSSLVKDIKDLNNYEWSSLCDYLGLNRQNICLKDFLLSLSGGVKNYKRFVFARADYQRRLKEIEHLILE